MDIRKDGNYHNLPCSICAGQAYNVLIKEGHGMERKQEDKPPEEPPEGLLKEIEWVRDHIPDGEVPQPAPDEFEKVWKRIQDGHGK